MMGRSYNTSNTQYDKDVRQSFEYEVKHSKDKVGTTSNYPAGSNEKKGQHTMYGIEVVQLSLYCVMSKISHDEEIFKAAYRQ